MSLLQKWRADRLRRQQAERYVELLMAPPPEALVERLAQLGDGDADHAAWEWRYARRALGLIVAERDAQDDRTVSEIAAVLGERQSVDPEVAADRRELARQQLNERVTAYRGAVANRVSSDPLAVRLGFVLLRFERPSVLTPQAAASLGVALDAMMADLNASLAEIYGPPAIADV